MGKTSEQIKKEKKVERFKKYFEIDYRIPGEGIMSDDFDMGADLGKGAFGKVCSYVDKVLLRNVAIKSLKTNIVKALNFNFF